MDGNGPTMDEIGIGMTSMVRWGRFSNLDAVFTEIRILPCYQA